jgi:hypothetical protein
MEPVRSQLEYIKSIQFFAINWHTAHILLAVAIVYPRELAGINGLRTLRNHWEIRFRRDVFTINYWQCQTWI